MKPDVSLRKAAIGDVSFMHQIINSNARAGVMLPRSLQELYENVRDFYVAEIHDQGVIGCCALHISWADLAEVKSLAVAQDFQKYGIGKLLVAACINEAKELGLQKVFALTMVPGFFEKQGFTRIPKNDLPHKIWTECVRCPHFPDCPEVALIKVLRG